MEREYAIGNLKYVKLQDGTQIVIDYEANKMYIFYPTLTLNTYL